MTISYATQRAVRRLLEDSGLGHAQIGRRAGCSRSTVGRIARGEGRLGAEDQSGLEAAGLSVRCEGCGGLVVPPCVLCEVRARIGRGTLSRPLGAISASSGTLGIELEGPERDRYLEIRRRRDLEIWDALAAGSETDEGDPDADEPDTLAPTADALNAIERAA